MASIVEMAPAAHARADSVAPWWHTAGLLVIFVVLGLGSAAARPAVGRPGAAPSPLVLYVPLIVIEWALLVYVARGLRRGKSSLREVIGGTWTSHRLVVRDIALGLTLWALWMGISAIWTRLDGSADQQNQVRALLPHGALGSSLWIIVSLTAGFVEEVVFRGYFQRQFAAWTNSALIGVLLQAALFGVAHRYQGLSACLRIVAYGALFGALALWRRSLRPDMIAHAWTDIASGLLLN